MQREVLCLSCAHLQQPVGDGRQCSTVAAAAPKWFGKHPLDQHQRTAMESGSHPDTENVNPPTWDSLLVEILAFYKQKLLDSSSLQTKYLWKKCSSLECLKINVLRGETQSASQLVTAINL